MQTVNIHEAKTHLSRYLERVAQGDEMIIARAGHPLARLVPYETAFAVFLNKNGGALFTFYFW